MLAAAVVRFLRAEPLLPADLTPDRLAGRRAAPTATPSTTGPSAGRCAERSISRCRRGG